MSSFLDIQNDLTYIPMMTSEDRSLSAAPALRVLVGLLSLGGLLGCASVERLTRPPLEPPLQGASWLEGTGGTRLYFSAKAPAGEPWGIVYFVLGPQIGAAEPYPEFTAALRASGLATAVLHPRGAGFSDGLRGDLDDYSLYLDDLRLGLARVRETFPGKAVFLFGHSAGATLALQVAARATPAPAGLVLVNPAFRLTYGEGMGPSFTDYLAFGFNAVFRRSALTVDMNGNPSAVRNAADRAEALALQRDPLVVRHFSLRYLLAQRAVMNACLENAAAVDAPLLLVQGAEDALVDPAGNDEILAAARTADKARLVAPRGAHGSSAVETVVEELLRWLQAHRPAGQP
jgi:alpha-beta hydrolase superfamily lysophospholipase